MGPVVSLIPVRRLYFHRPRERCVSTMTILCCDVGSIKPAATAAMAERGIDISTEYPKPWTDEVVRAADVVITMGGRRACPVFPGRRYEEWALGPRVSQFCGVLPGPWVVATRRGWRDP